LNKSLQKVTLKELAAIVGAQLKKYEIDAVLTGGACVSVYSENRYQSLDLDFVTNAVEDKPAAIKKALGEIGFDLRPEGFFGNDDCPFIIEFIPLPLAVGREPVKEISTIKTRTGSFRLLSPTDCVKDRLAAFYHWNDRQSLEQALMVAKRHKIDKKEVKRWSKNENMLDKYEIFDKKAKAI